MFREILSSCVVEFLKFTLASTSGLNISCRTVDPRKKALASNLEILYNANMAAKQKTSSGDAKTKKQAGELMTGMVQLMEAPMRLGRHPLPELALSPAEVRVLIFLGDRGETIMTELAAAIDTPLSTVTRIADRLERKGLIERSRSDRDRRIVVVTPSGKGKKLHDAARQDQLAMAHRMLELLSPDEREIFLTLVAKLALGLQETPR